ncbi:MAG: hypothetical protein NTX97_08065 [Bacteroidetes bacterium]|nr:hypothetical protein [Bacteroidota bacterium]
MLKIWPYKIKPNEVIVTDIGNVFINENGILVMKYINDLDFVIEKARAAIKVCEDIVGDNKVSVMVVTGEFGNMSTETREYLSGKEIAKHRKAVALVVNNLSHRLISQFIIKLRNNFYPTQVFKNEEDTLNWLMGNR